MELLTLFLARTATPLHELAALPNPGNRRAQLHR